MKVMFINSVVDYGSTGKLVRDLSDGLIKKGHEVSIVYGRHQAENTKNTLKVGSKFGVLRHVFMSKIFGRHALHSNKATDEVIKQIESFKPEVIHLHNLHGYYINFYRLMNYLKNKKDIKIIWTLHDFWSVSGSTAYFHFDGCSTWDEGCVEVNNPHTYPASYFIKRQKKNFLLKKKTMDGFSNLQIVCVSEWQKREIEKTFLNQYPIKTIYNGINTDVFKPEKTEIKNKKTLLGVANIWEQRKGLDDFIHLSQLIGTNYIIKLVGLSKKQIENLPDNIVGLEKTASVEDLVSLYNEADIYINFSVEETMGLTTVEALACGTPVITYDETAVPEMVGEQTGIVVKNCDLEAVLSAIDEISNNRNEYSRCREYVLEKFKKEDMIASYISLYLET